MLCLWMQLMAPLLMQVSGSLLMADTAQDTDPSCKSYTVGAGTHHSGDRSSEIQYLEVGAGFLRGPCCPGERGQWVCRTVLGAGAAPEGGRNWLLLQGPMWGEAGPSVEVTQDLSYIPSQPISVSPLGGTLSMTLVINLSLAPGSVCLHGN